MTRTLTFSPRIWAALDAGDLTMPVAIALQTVEDGATIYAAAKLHQQHLRTVQRAWERLATTYHSP